jgi:alpha-N-arabinofuranosidase
VEQEGIDPSLLFDGDKVYFTSNGCDADGKPCILQCEIDIATGEKLTDSVPVWHGSGGRYLESPHLYHIGGMYYLTAAEGGTEYGHMITYARSENPFGPFEGFSGNPVLTNRNLGGNQSLIQGIGHGDLIEDENGDYYIVCLGFRQSGMWQPYHHLGREVFLAPVSWDDAGWFYAGENGTVAEWMDTGLSAKKPAADCYDVTTLDITNPRWCYLRDYHRENYIYEDDILKLRGTGLTLEEADTPTFVGVRQSEFETKLCVTVGGNAAEAGFSFYMDESQHYDLALVQNEDKSEVVLKLKVGDAQAVKNAIPVENGEVSLEAESTPDEYSFFVRQGDKRRFVGSARTKYLSSEVAGGFTGVVIGLYAIDEDGRWAEFKDFSLTQRHI